MIAGVHSTPRWAEFTHIGALAGRKRKPGSHSLFRREFPGPIVARLLLPGSNDSAGVAYACLLLRDLDLADHFPRTDTEQRLHLLFHFRHQCRRVLEV